MENPLQSECSALPSADAGHRTLHWATAAASTPVTVHNRYSVLVDDDGNVFEEPRLRKRRRSRLEQRQQRQQQQQQYPPTAAVSASDIR